MKTPMDTFRGGPGGEAKTAKWRVHLPLEIVEASQFFRLIVPLLVTPNLS